MKRTVLACLLLIVAVLLAACTATVPDLRGLDRVQAGTALDRASLALESTRDVWDSKVPSGQVVSQTPPPNTKTKRGARVVLILSKGPEPARFAYEGPSFNKTDPLVGEKVTVSVKVSNLGDLPGRAQVVLALDGRTVAERSVDVTGHASARVSVQIAVAQLGPHKVQVVGGPSTSLVIRRWVLLASLSGGFTRPKPLGGGAPYYPGMPAYHPDMLAKERSREFSVSEATDLKLEWTVSRGHPGASIDVRVPQKRGTYRVIPKSIAANRDGTEVLTVEPGTYWLEVLHEYCDWTVKLWVKR